MERTEVSRIKLLFEAKFLKQHHIHFVYSDCYQMLISRRKLLSWYKEGLKLVEGNHDQQKTCGILEFLVEH